MTLNLETLRADEPPQGYLKDDGARHHVFAFSFSRMETWYNILLDKWRILKLVWKIKNLSVWSIDNVDINLEDGKAQRRYCKLSLLRQDRTNFRIFLKHLYRTNISIDYYSHSRPNGTHYVDCWRVIPFVIARFDLRRKGERDRG